MKKIIILFIMIIFGISLIGCNVENNDNEYSSEKLVANLLSLKTTVNNDIESGEENISLSNEMETLAKDILEMSIIEFQKFSAEYNSIIFKNYSFVLFEDSICVIVKYSNDYLSIAEVKVFLNFVPDASKKSIVKGMDVFTVVSLMGYPYLVQTSSDKLLDFKMTNDEVIRVVFDENMKVSEISNIDYDSLYDPSYTVDDKCGTEDNKPELSKAILILENMTFEEVVELIGKPHKSFGSGAIWYEWTLENGKKLQVQFGPGHYGDETLYVVKYIIK